MKNKFLRILHRITSRLNRTKIRAMDALSLNPKDFSWKMRWRMKHDRNPLFVDVQDKYKVKAYAHERGVRTAETFYVTNDPETIPFDTLPDNYFIKANHGYGWNILCKEREFYFYRPDVNSAKRENIIKYKLTRQEVLEHCRIWINTKHSKWEWAYQHISPLIIVEEILASRDGGELKDYKFYTFNGIVKMIQILSPSIRQNNENVLFDPRWQEFKLPNDKYKHSDVLPRRPDTLQDMVVAAEKLGKGLDFVRVDLYDTTCGVTLGEMTIYPEGGRLNSPSYDSIFNKWLGDQWILPGAK